MFLQSITKTVTKALDASTAIPAVADESVSGRRHAVGIYATADVYVGGSDVTADTGIKIPAGESKVFPVNNSRALYVVGGTCVVADFF
jgi:hypothetical protein